MRRPALVQIEAPARGRLQSFRQLSGDSERPSAPARPALGPVTARRRPAERASTVWQY